MVVNCPGTHPPASVATCVRWHEVWNVRWWRKEGGRQESGRVWQRHGEGRDCRW